MSLFRNFFFCFLYASWIPLQFLYNCVSLNKSFCLFETVSTSLKCKVSLGDFYNFFPSSKNWFLILRKFFVVVETDNLDKWRRDSPENKWYIISLLEPKDVEELFRSSYFGYFCFLFHYKLPKAFKDMVINISVSFGSFPAMKKKAEGFVSGSRGGWSILVIFPIVSLISYSKERGTRDLKE